MCQTAVSLHANTYQVDAALVGRRVELVLTWKPSRSATVTSRMGKPCRTPSPATPTPRPDPKPPSPSRRRRLGSSYLALTAAHHEQLRGEERIGYHALYGSSGDGQIPGQRSIDDLQPSIDVDHEGELST